ncbi:Inositolphosphorylceramide synthase subunit Kei1-domain-containing protein [Papiliotrema laurentii]|uniref:Inositolphosphorylceramide synthase subunit Kei1-domain-containing protein n=1 Tax=Papiliotrema laurentii TaxID=5418 RepID=A0AAD9FQR5_PAPLA|nr:Inositolphosphorylceramide synthase subunit Kei1-domain-containing protein [Papiliotrema laurentii]
MRLNFRLASPGAVFNSFLGALDIKLGAEIVLLFGLINKVAGLYGLVVIFIGGSLTQIAFYAYSTASLFAFLWALRIVKSESASTTTTVAHLYTLDHLVQSLFHYLFYLDYWYNVPHDGRRTANSQAQQDLINLAASRGEIIDPATQETPGMDELRKALAGDIWRTEKVYAGWTLVFGFFLKVYFILTLYSYAAHLRSSTYHTLPLTSRSTATQIAHPDPPQPTRGPGDATAGPSSRQSNPRQDAVGKEMERLRQEEEGFSWE